MFLVEDGVVKIVRSENGERDVIVALRFRHWLVGMAAAIVNRPYPATAVALGPCSVRPIPVLDFNRLRRSSRRFAASVEHALADEVFGQIAGAGRFGLKSRARLRGILRDLAEPCGRKQRDGSVKLQVHITHADLADLIATTREHICRLVREMETLGSLRRQGGWFVLTRSFWTSQSGPEV